MIRLLLQRIVLISLSLFVAADAQAHALDPGYLEITRIQSDNFRIFWRKPDVKGSPMDIDVSLPDNCARASGPAPRFDGAAWVSEWITSCPGGIQGASLAIVGLEQTRTDVLLRVQDAEAAIANARLTSEASTWIIPADNSGWAVLQGYIELGMDHIFEGFDHLLFVFALIFLLRDPWRLFGAITAFTAAHSITLALAALGIVHVPAPPVEAIIALSILFLAVEIAKSDEGSMRLSERWPWIVCLSFGLLHGLGFAGALTEIGLPEGDIFFALLGFNLGVEVGQLLFVAAILTLGRVLSWIKPFATSFGSSNRYVSNLIASYAIGSVAAFWLVERVTGFWS